MRHRLLLLLFPLLAACQTAAQTEEKPDIDEWQVLKAEAVKDPFARSNEFSVNFAAYTDSEWCYPLPGARVISPFGGKRRHAGTDLKTRTGALDTIYAVFAGTVTLSGPHFGYGNFVLIRHANGLETGYSHNTKNLVKVGQWVRAGQPVAIMGRTGRSSTDHLHFETRVNGKAFDSEKIFDHAAHQLRRAKFVFTRRPNGTLRITSEAAKAQ